MATVRALIVLIAIGAGLFLAVVYSGAYNVAASVPHGPFMTWLLGTTLQNSVEAHANGIAVPDLSGEDRLREGGRHYRAMCAACHLSPVRRQSELRAGLTPRPPDFTRGVGAWSPAERFWIVKHGIKMTGMPAWGETYDDTLWSIVAFLQRLPDLSPEAYRALTAEPVPAGGPAAGHRHDSAPDANGPVRDAGGHDHAGYAH